jgi:hypothetical protein
MKDKVKYYAWRWETAGEVIPLENEGFDNGLTRNKRVVVGQCPARMMGCAAPHLEDERRWVVLREDDGMFSATPE